MTDTIQVTRADLRRCLDALTNDAFGALLSPSGVVDALAQLTPWQPLIALAQLAYDTLGRPGRLSDALDVIEEQGALHSRLQAVMGTGPTDLYYFDVADQRWWFGSPQNDFDFSGTTYNGRCGHVLVEPDHERPTFFLEPEEDPATFAVTFRTGQSVLGQRGADPHLWTPRNEDIDVLRGRWRFPTGPCPYRCELVED